MFNDYLEKAFGETEAKKLNELWENNHTELGNDLFVKMCKSFPEIRKEKWASKKGILWWILHNQEEVVFRLERCRKLLSRLANEQDLSLDLVEEDLTELVVLLDHLKQNLTFLVGELDSYSYYIVEGALEANCFSIQDAKIYGLELVKAFSIKNSDSESYDSSFNKLKERLLEYAADKELIAATFDSLFKLLSSADVYCAELKNFILCEANPTVVFCRFRRVVAEGMKLLFHAISAETAIKTLRLQITK